MSDKSPTLRLPIPGPAHTDDVAEILAAIAALDARVDAKFSEIEAHAEEINQRLAPILATIKANLDHIRHGGP